MNRLLLGLAVVAALGAAAALSRQKPDQPAAAPGSPLKIEAGEKNPWTGLALNNDPDQFRFAVVADRTGGHRAKVFSRAVHQINLLQPEFVMSVGDLIEGYAKEPEKAAKQWDEFDGYARKFDMPFFYVPGNHDLANQMMIEQWGGRYGKTYYHFVYKNTLFIAVNSEDGKASLVTPEQTAAVRAALDANKGVRWTLVFVHKPLWAEKDPAANGWLAVEEALAGRKYTVFCGHVHRYQKFVRNGMNYYQLATTGGVSRLRGVRYGEFDHVTWVTMKKDGPVLANILLDGVLPEDLRLPETEEPGWVSKRQPTVPVKGVVTLDGQPLAGVTVTFSQQDPPAGFRAENADALTEADGSFVLSTYAPADGAPVGKYKVVVARTGRGYYDGAKAGKVAIPEAYTKGATTPLTFEVREGANEARIELTSK